MRWRGPKTVLALPISRRCVVAGEFDVAALVRVPQSLREMVRLLRSDPHNRVRRCLTVRCGDEWPVDPALAISMYDIGPSGTALARSLMAAAFRSQVAISVNEVRCGRVRRHADVIAYPVRQAIDVVAPAKRQVSHQALEMTPVLLVAGSDRVER